MTLDIDADTESLKTVTDTLRALVDEARWHIDPDDGLTASAVDPANVGMVDLSLSPKGFASIQGSALLGVNLTSVDDVLGIADEFVFLELNESTNKLEWESSGLSYTQALIDPDSIRQGPDLPDLDPPVRARLDVDAWERGIKAADLVGDHVRLTTRFPNELVIHAQGDTDDVSTTYTNGDDALESLRISADSPDEGDEWSSNFSLDYLKKMTRAMPSDATLTITHGSEFPTKIEHDLLDGEGSVTWMLAPRVESD